MWENISLAMAGLMANKMRALLTMLGIIIGIGSVIAIITVGDSLTNSMTSSMNDMGAGNIIVSVREKDGSTGEGGPMRAMGGSSALQPEEDDLISDEQLENFTARFSDRLSAVSLSGSLGSGKVQDGRLYANVSIMGVNEGYESANSIELLSGRFLNQRDIKSVKNVAVVSDKLVSNLFSPGALPLGEEIKCYQGGGFETYTIVGIYRYVASSFGGFGTSSDRDISTNLFVPVSVSQKSTGVKGHQTFTAVANPGQDATQLAADIQAYWDKIYARNDKWECSILNMETMIDTMSSMMGTLSVAVAIIAAISLLVGGIGVMNIMLVSVTERTREIGTRKALGAKNTHIRLQFIVESMIICLIGGVIGILLGLLLGAGGSALLGFPASVSAGVIFLCVAFSMLVGVFFGSYPASKAAKLDPIEALRYE